MNELTDLLDTAAIFHYHQSLIQSHGSGTTEALGWMRPEGQQARFQILSRIGDLNHCSVLDAGCGHADLFPFLKNRYPAIRYYGLEQVPQFLAIAAERYQTDNCTLLSGNFMQADVPQTDYVLACGSLSYRHQEDAFIYWVIEKLFNSCRLGLGFNLLSGGMQDSSLLVNYDSGKIYRFCQTLSPQAELHQGYWENDFTIFMYR